MALQELTSFLDENGVDYSVRPHSLAYTAQEVAAAAHIPGREMAKTVMVKLDGQLVMAVLPACNKVNLERIARQMGCADAELASEEEFRDVFRGCTVGAMPPFGNLWQVPVCVCRSLAQADRIAFNGGSHTELITMDFNDFRRLAAPHIIDFSDPA